MHNKILGDVFWPKKEQFRGKGYPMGYDGMWVRKYESSLAPFNKDISEFSLT